MASNPLTDVIPGKYRRYLYGGVFVVGLASTALQGAHGDWGQAVPSFVASLVSALGFSNVKL